MSKFLKIGGGIAAALLLTGVGLHLWSTSASSARLAQTWPDVQGKAVSVPMPLTEAEVDSLRAELVAAGTDHSGAPLVASAGEDGSETLPNPSRARTSLRSQASVPWSGASTSTTSVWLKECHQADGGGGLVVDAQPVWTWYAPNITSGGKTASYSPEDWDRLVRHGVKPDDTNATMPAIDYMALSDRELSDVIAYVQSLPAVDAVQPETVLGPVGRCLAAARCPLLRKRSTTRFRRSWRPRSGCHRRLWGAHRQVCVGCHRLYLKAARLRRVLRTGRGSEPLCRFLQVLDPGTVCQRAAHGCAT